MPENTALVLLRQLGKPVLMPALAARFTRSPRGPGFALVILAQACSWGGDIALNGRTRRRFLTGLGLFLTAHLAYLGAYRTRTSVPVLASRGPRRVLIAGSVASTAMALAAARSDRAVAVPVAVYGFTLSTLVATAATADVARGRRRLLTGSVLFVVSDTLIGIRRFLSRDQGDALGVAIMATYAAAQWNIAEGMVGPDGDGSTRA